MNKVDFVDVFNGDADGICALQQMRLVEPVDSMLVTGVKRDIALVEKVTTAENVLVLDISLDKNRDDITRLLENGSTIRYFDHHFAGDIPAHTNFESFINTSKNVCTSILVNQYLDGKHVLWAAVGAFGDNMADEAKKLLINSQLSGDKLIEMQELGIYLNYNGYGATVDDLYFAPGDLYQALHPYSNPLDFIEDSDEFDVLKAGYHDDMQMGKQAKLHLETDTHAVIMLPNEKWARRISGVLGNELANEFPGRAHALISELESGHFQVSVRAPKVNRTGADELCRQFETGGGRQAAAGINRLPTSELDRFVEEFLKSF